MVALINQSFHALFPEILYVSGLLFYFYKWHLGFFKFAYTPSKRGFDSFFGYWTGKEDYWDHSSSAPGGGWGLDFHNNTEVTTNRPILL